eukprot:scaffold22_cov401-Pavlova_lutheri.AAC.6
MDISDKHRRKRRLKRRADSACLLIYLSCLPPFTSTQGIHSRAVNRIYPGYGLPKHALVTIALEQTSFFVGIGSPLASDDGENLHNAAKVIKECPKSADFSSHYKFAQVIGSGCIAYAVLVHHLQSNATGLVKLHHGKGCKLQGDRAASLKAVQHLLDNTESQKGLIEAGMRTRACPNVMRVKDVACHRGKLIAILQPCTGEPLSSFYGERCVAQLHHVEIASILRQLVSAILCMLRRGILLTDMGRPNVLFNRLHNQVCIIDLDGMKKVRTSTLMAVNEQKSEVFMSKVWKQEKVIKSFDPLLTTASHILALLGHPDVQPLTRISKLVDLLGTENLQRYEHKYNIRLNGVSKTTARTQRKFNFSALLHEENPVNRFLFEFLKNVLDYSYTNKLSAFEKSQLLPFEVEEAKRART